MQVARSAFGCSSRLSSSSPVAARAGRHRRSSCSALKRVTEPVYFQEVFVGAAERIFTTNGFLKREETMVLVESVRSLEHAYKTLELIGRHLENRAGMDVNDWHHRKKYYMRLCELAMKLERGPDVVFALFGNLQRFQIQTYFGKEVIQRLCGLGAHPGILLRIAELCKLQRGPQDKGVRAAYAELVQLLQTRNSPLDQEFLPRAKADMKALRHVIKVQPGGMQPGMVQPVPVLQPQAAPEQKAVLAATPQQAAAL